MSDEVGYQHCAACGEPHGGTTCPYVLKLDIEAEARKVMAEEIVEQDALIDLLVTALRATDRRTDPFDDEPCWCWYARLTASEKHDEACLCPRAALARVEGGGR